MLKLIAWIAANREVTFSLRAAASAPADREVTFLAAIFTYCRRTRLSISAYGTCIFLSQRDVASEELKFFVHGQL